MDVIDEQGRLFGVVNLIDGLVVLLVLAVGIAGAALVLGGLSEDTGLEERQYATVSYSVPFGSGTSILAPNDTLTPVDGGETYTVRDAHYGTTPSGDVWVVARVSYSSTPQIGGETVRVGNRYEMFTNSSQMLVRFRSIEGDSETLSTSRVGVVVAINESTQVSQALESGAVATVEGRTVARVTGVSEETDESSPHTELVGLELQAVELAERNWFGGRTIRVNNRITVATEDVVVTGRIYEIGTTEVGNVTGG